MENWMIFKIKMKNKKDNQVKKVINWKTHQVYLKIDMSLRENNIELKERIK
jgi:hypothetical protein